MLAVHCVIETQTIDSVEPETGPFVFLHFTFRMKNLYTDNQLK